jgi:hypothetical protein
MTDAGGVEDLRHTNESAAIDDELLALTTARPRYPSEAATASGLDVLGQGATLEGRAAEEDEDIVVADDLADLIEVDDDELEAEEHALAAAPEPGPTPEEEKPKRRATSIPPPLPRS